MWVASRAGDGAAFGVLFDRHHARVHQHARRLLDSPTDAEDVTAAAFLELWRRREDVRLVAGSLLPWLLVTCTNLARNTQRARRRYRELLARLHQHPRGAQVPDAAEDALAQQVGDERLAVALRALRAVDLQLITLVALEGFSVAEAASAVGLREGAAKTRLHRARTRLRAALAEHPEAQRLLGAAGGQR
ncbi:hypothetical protein GCM10027586_07830 [Kineococcus gypseus]|uniref:RNA polymerase sigma factor n=1 Tax=Kineococcus gypseus TaxID=1637102 RepID=UPI003D7C9A01